MDASDDPRVGILCWNDRSGEGRGMEGSRVIDPAAEAVRERIRGDGVVLCVRLDAAA